ncbi:hypothetical protein BI291_13845 [Thalassotalea sp. PP2-459]|nr:hypothetical protein BI291_13845 [Thalassotalea sp. PP2-459]
MISQVRFKVLKGKRKELAPIRDNVAPRATVNPIHIIDMNIAVPGRGKMYFKRFKYKGCPVLDNQTADFKKGALLVDMKRNDLIRNLYQLMSKDTNQTTYSHFCGVINYIRWLDGFGLKAIKGDWFHMDLINEYMKWFSEECALNRKQKTSWSADKKALSWVLKQLNRSLDAKSLPSVKGATVGNNSYQAHDLETELKPLAKSLFKAYKSLLKHFKESTLPERHPLYDEELLNKVAIERGLKGNKLVGQKAAFKKALQKSDARNHIVRIAMMITYMFTGINTNPLAKLKISDIYFKEVQGGKYIFDSSKGRARNQEQDNSLGFNKHAKEFIESWLSVAKTMAEGDISAPVFPYFKQDGSVTTYDAVINSPQTSINKLLEKLGLPTINPSRFRKSKLDTLFRVTQSVYLVAMSGNNSINVVARNYVHGTKTEHQNNLGAAMDAKYAIANGKEIKAATEAAKYKFADILDNYEYEHLRAGKDRNNESRTPLGVRCNDNKKGSASIIRKLLKKEGVDTTVEESFCTDFLSCFECEHHALVADVMDIWLMLSFKETLQQLQQLPAVNSMPEKRYTWLFNIIESILKRFKEKSSSNFLLAEEKIKEAAHPLYNNVYSLNDLFEVFS